MDRELWPRLFFAVDFVTCFKFFSVFIPTLSYFLSDLISLYIW